LEEGFSNEGDEEEGVKSEETAAVMAEVKDSSARKQGERVG
jgi:hypothetical protein